MKVTFRIFRFNPETDEKPYYKDYEVNADPKDRVVDVLHYIKNEIDGTLTFRRSCLHGICGSDGMRINGKNMLACCKTLDIRIETKLIKSQSLLNHCLGCRL